MAECLSLHKTTLASPNKCMTLLLALRNSVEVGVIVRLASLATSAETIDWLAPVSGIQRTSRPRPQAVGGPSHRGISGVGILAGVKKAPACEGAEEADEVGGGAIHEDALSAGKEPS